MFDSRPPGISVDDTFKFVPPAGDDVTEPRTVVNGRYRIERIVGEGAFGRVYHAFDTRLEHHVAIKELLSTRETADYRTYEHYLERFRREARAAFGIHHPNVVTVLELQDDSAGNTYLVMEYVDGTNLRDLLRKVPMLAVERAVAIAMDVARGLEAINERGIVHRDLKPANILISSRGVAKVTDFGVALVPSEIPLTETNGGHPGTLPYMSPEQMPPYRLIDGRSDLYSLGLILYEMLVGQQYAVIRQPVRVMRPDLPPQLIGIIERLLQPQAEWRYQHAAEVARDLQAFLYGMGQETQTKRRHPRTGLAIGAGGAVTVALIALLLHLVVVPTPPVPTTVPPTPGPQTKTPPTSVPPTVIPPTKPPTVVPPTVVPIRQVAPFTDANGLIHLRYPLAWRQSRDTSDANNLLLLSDGGSQRDFYTFEGSVKATTGTIDAELTSLEDTQANSKGNVYRKGKESDETIGGSRAKLLTYQIAPQDNPSAFVQSKVWIVNHGTSQFTFYAHYVDQFPAETSAIVSSILFPPPLARTQTKPYQDARFTFQYPSDWQQTKEDPKQYPNNVVFLQGPDGVTFSVDVLDGPQGSLGDATQRTRGGAPAQFAYGPVQSATVGKQSAEMYNFIYTPAGSETGHADLVWVVYYGGREYYIEADNVEAHLPEINAIIASMVLK